MKLVKVLVMCCLCSATFSVNAQSWKNALKKGIKEAIETKNDKKQLNSMEEEQTNQDENVQQQESDQQTYLELLLPKTDISLMAMGEGANQEEAMNDATNDVIGQVNTTFSASASNDIIKRSRVLASCVTPDSKTYVTMQFIIDGTQWLGESGTNGLASFGGDLKKEELCRANGLKVLDDILVPIEKLLPISFDRKVLVKPEETSTKDFLYKTLSVPYNPDRWNIDKDMHSYILDDEYNTPKELIQPLKNWIEGADNSYLVDMTIHFEPNQNTQQLLDLIDETIKARMLINMRELPNDKRREMAQFVVSNWNHITVNWGDLNSTKSYISGHHPLPFKNLRDWQNKIANMFIKEICNFVVLDNEGKESSFSASEIVEKEEKYIHGLPHSIEQGQGLFSPFFILNPNHIEFSDPSSTNRNTTDSNGKISISLSNKDRVWEMQFLIPKSDISKYTGFRAIRK